MKHLFLIFAAQLIAFGLFAQKKDRVEDFRGIPWGSHIDSCYNEGEPIKFKKQKNSVGEQTFSLDGERMSLGAARLSSVNYYFSESDKKFYKVIVAGNRNDVADVVFILNNKFGDSTDPTEVDGVWYRQWVVQDVTFTLAQFEARDFELTIESDWEEAERYRKNTNVKDF